METQSTTPDTRTLDEYLRALRSVQPTPGGGSAAAYCGALGASLGAMVCRLTSSKPSNDENTSLTEVAYTIDAIVDRLSQAARDDERCFANYQAATRLPKATEDQKRDRKVARQEALRLAAEAPLEAAELALQALQALPEVARLGTHHALSDVDVARILLEASIDGSLINVQVNVDMVTDEAAATAFSIRMSELRQSARDADRGIQAALAQRSN